MIYFTADTHFCHSNIINLSNRPFRDLEEMHKTLIHNWNFCVTDKDDIYILGDFMYKGSGLEANNILRRLKGRKYLIRGNHEKYIESQDFDASLFEWVKDYYVLRHEKADIVMFHYPILEWEGYFRGAIHLYGHVHNSLHEHELLAKERIFNNRAMNVGVDVNDYFPVDFYTVLQRCGGTAGM